MPSAITALKSTGAVALGSAVAGIGYASIIERNAFVLRELTIPVLDAGLVAAAGAAHQRPAYAAGPASKAGVAA